MSKEREAIERLRGELARRVRKFNDIHDDSLRDEALKDDVHRILSEWEQDRRNLPKFWQNFFGGDLLKGGESFLKKITEGYVKNSVLASSAAAATAAVASPASAPILVAAGIGFGVGVLFNLGRALVKTREDIKGSPYHFLTLCEKKGIAFTIS